MRQFLPDYVLTGESSQLLLLSLPCPAFLAWGAAHGGRGGHWPAQLISWEQASSPVKPSAVAVSVKSLRQERGWGLALDWRRCFGER